MENPLSKFVPFLVGEFPRPFQDLVKKVSQNEQIINENLENNASVIHNLGLKHKLNALLSFEKRLRIIIQVNFSGFSQDKNLR